jgi:hypothetical protein
MTTANQTARQMLPADSRTVQAICRRAYSAANNEGMGYAPYTDEAGDDTHDEAVRCAIADEWEVIVRRGNSEEVTVLGNADGEVLAIGSQADGSGAWAVDLTARLVARIDE